MAIANWWPALASANQRNVFEILFDGKRWPAMASADHRK